MHLTRLLIVHYNTLDDYMKILRFHVMKEVVLDKKIHDQSVQQIRQNMSFPKIMDHLEQENSKGIYKLKLIR